MVLLLVMFFQIQEMVILLGFLLVRVVQLEPLVHLVQVELQEQVDHQEPQVQVVSPALLEHPVHPEQVEHPVHQEQVVSPALLVHLVLQEQVVHPVHPEQVVSPDLLEHPVLLVQVVSPDLLEHPVLLVQAELLEFLHRLNFIIQIQFHLRHKVYLVVYQHQLLLI